MGDSYNVGNNLNSILGLKHYVGCDSEWMDYIAFNVTTYEDFYKAKCTENDSSYPIDYTAHIYDPVTKRSAQSRLLNHPTGIVLCVSYMERNVMFFRVEFTRQTQACM